MVQCWLRLLPHRLTAGQRRTRPTASRGRRPEWQAEGRFDGNGQNSNSKHALINSTYNSPMTTGGKLFLAGLAVTAVGAAAVFRRVAELPSARDLVDLLSGNILILVGIVLATVGFFVYVFQPAFNPEEAQRSAGTVRTILAMIAVIIVLGNLLSLPYLLVTRSASPKDALGLAYLIAASDAPILFVVWLRLARPGCLDWPALGLATKGVGQRLSQGLAGGFALFTASAVVGSFISRFGVQQNQFERFDGVVGAPIGFFFVTLFAGCVLAPLAEELFFRGYVFHTLMKERGPVWAYLFSAGLFAVLHVNAAATLPIFVLGLILAFIFQRTGSLLPGIIAHGLNNALAFAILYAGVRG